MRTRQEIEKDKLNPKYDGYSLTNLAIFQTLEVLLDIRDLLMKDNNE